MLKLVRWFDHIFVPSKCKFNYCPNRWVLSVESTTEIAGKIQSSQKVIRHMCFVEKPEFAYILITV